jgi:hypothetical protein
LAGTIIADKIQTENAFLTLNVGQTLVATINASGILSNTGTTMIAANGRFSNTALTGTITGSQISSNTVANTNIQTGAIENYSRDQYLSINRNKLINGDMRIDQRYAGANTVIPAYTATYVMDRWFGNAQPNASKFSMQQVNSANTSASNYEASSAPSGYANSMKVNSTTAMSVSTGEIYYVAQRIEGFNSYRLGWGAAGAKTVTLSFWVKSSVTGTLGGSIVNSANDYCYPFSYTIVAANTWEQKFITIAGPTSGSWKTDFNIGIQINFALATGSSYTATAGSWTGTANIFGATGQTNVLASQGNTWYLTGVQFEVGSTATNFEFRHQGTELAMCQRYYWKVSGDGSGIGGFGSGQCTGSTNANIIFSYPVTMRTAPTITQGGTYTINFGAGNSTVSSFTAYTSSGYGRIDCAITGATTGYGAAGWLTNGTSNFISGSAEL